MYSLSKEEVKVDHTRRFCKESKVSGGKVFGRAKIGEIDGKMAPQSGVQANLSDQTGG